ncbi:MAG: hypothetical protein ACRCX4_05985 [Bacteroidales bacterium]
MKGREKKEDNDLFFLCSLIEYIARKTKNHRNVIVKSIGICQLQKIYNLSDVYHSENIDKLAESLIESSAIPKGHFDNIALCKFSIPTHWDIGKVYKRLILSVCLLTGKEVIPALAEVYDSWLSRKLEDYNSSLYYESPDYLASCYEVGDIL